MSGVSRNAVRITLIFLTLVAEGLLFFFALGYALGGNARQDYQWQIRLLLAQMPILAIGVVACMTGRAWPTRLAKLIGFVLLGVDVTLITVELMNSYTTWLIIFFVFPAAVVLGGVLLMGRARSEPTVVAPPPTGEWR